MSCDSLQAVTLLSLFEPIESQSVDKRTNGLLLFCRLDLLIDNGLGPLLHCANHASLHEAADQWWSGLLVCSPVPLKTHAYTCSYFYYVTFIQVILSHGSSLLLVDSGE